MKLCICAAAILSLSCFATASFGQEKTAHTVSQQDNSFLVEKPASQNDPGGGSSLVIEPPSSLDKIKNKISDNISPMAAGAALVASGVKLNDFVNDIHLKQKKDRELAVKELREKLQRKFSVYLSDGKITYISESIVDVSRHRLYNKVPAVFIGVGAAIEAYAWASSDPNQPVIESRKWPSKKAPALPLKLENVNVSGSKLLLACSIPQEAIERCELSGGAIDTARCQCVGEKANSKLPQQCDLVCRDGSLDVQNCRCVEQTEKPSPQECNLVCLNGSLEVQNCRCVDQLEDKP